MRHACPSLLRTNPAQNLNYDAERHCCELREHLRAPPGDRSAAPTQNPRPKPPAIVAGPSPAPPRLPAPPSRPAFPPSSSCPSTPPPPRPPPPHWPSRPYWPPPPYW